MSEQITWEGVHFVMRDGWTLARLREPAPRSSCMLLHRFVKVADPWVDALDLDALDPDADEEAAQDALLEVVEQAALSAHVGVMRRCSRCGEIRVEQR